MLKKPLSWLLTEGGAVIRYRALSELHLDPPDYTTSDIISDIIASPKVASWLDLHPSTFPGSPLGLHGSQKVLYENFIPKMGQFGLDASVDALNSYLAFFQSKIDLSKNWGSLNLVKSCYAALTVLVGIQDDHCIAFLVNRLKEIASFVRERSYDIYADPAAFPTLPRSLRNRPVLNPELYLNDIIPVPTIYDVLAAKALYNTPCINASHINTIMEYIFDDRFAALHPQYGIYYDTANKRFYAHGWKPHLENYSSQTTPIQNKALFLLQLYLFSHFPIVHSQTWFNWGLEVLNAYQTKQETYLLPKGFLQEKPSGYWVNGAYMGLGESRRKNDWQELESTFWVMSIRKNLMTRESK
jgi:hypothetical protein